MTFTHPKLSVRRALLACLITAALALLVTVPGAAASTYGVHQCTTQQPNVDDAAIEGQTTGYAANNACTSAGGYLQVGASGAVTPGQGKAWTFSAPSGTRINAATGFYVLQGAADNGGHAPYLFIRPVGGAEQTVAQNNGAGSVSGNYDSSLQNGPIDRIGIGIVCTRSAGQGNCPSRGGIYSRMSGLGFSMQDTVAPDMPSTSGNALGGWVGGTKSVSYSVSDAGAGVYVGGSFVNDSVADLKVHCSPALAPSGAAKRFQPCPGSASGSTSFDLGASPFLEGFNTLQTCVSEYGEANLAQTCKTDTIQVDTVAPTAPSSLAVAGGEGWKRDRDDFDLSWSNPAQGGATAPLVGAGLRITGPGGYSNTTYHAGNDRTSINDVAVPNVVGDYTATVYLRDAAGNETVANGSSVHLRFDDTVPVRSDPAVANGWINRPELGAGYLQEWDKPTLQETPPSGIAGFRVLVNTNSDTDPCSGASDQRACGGPITELGVTNDSRVLGNDDLIEGLNYVHVAPVSGSGMRATAVGHAPLKVDLTDPVTGLAGDGNGGWLNHDVNLIAVSSDSVSGMQDNDEFPDDLPPTTFLEVDGQLASEPDESVSRTVTAEGSHQVRFWARDLAGNENAGAPGAATVRIDSSEPEVAFTSAQDPEDPDKLIAPVSDALSGVVEGRISYREEGGAEWKALDTAVGGGQLEARVDSGDLRPGVTYEFRAIATDRAGNSRTSTSKVNGEPMRVTGPFRTMTGVVDLRVNGKPKSRVVYGKRAKVNGTLLTDEDGRPVAGAAVEIVETFGFGSKQRTRTRMVLTDSQGGFATKLGRGPSRTIVARYAGDRRYLGTSSAAAKLGVRSKVTLHVPPAAREGGTTTFSGKVMAKGAKLGRAGKRLEIQVRIGNAWKAVGRSIRTNAKGAYVLTYRFTADYTEPVRFQFRAVVLRERSFPYLASVSKRRSVTVSP